MNLRMSQKLTCKQRQSLPSLAIQPSRNNQVFKTTTKKDLKQILTGLSPRCNVSKQSLPTLSPSYRKSKNNRYENGKSYCGLYMVKGRQTQRNKNGLNSVFSQTYGQSGMFEDTTLDTATRKHQNYNNRIENFIESKKKVTQFLEKIKLKALKQHKKMSKKERKTVSKGSTMCTDGRISKRSSNISISLDPTELEKIKVNAIIKIQSFCRRYLSAQKVTDLRQRHRSAVVIQSFIRGWIARRHKAQYIKGILDYKLTALDDLSNSLRHKAFKNDVKYYCKIWLNKTKKNIRERHLYARKAFVFYSLTVYREMIKERKRKAEQQRKLQLSKHRSKPNKYPNKLVSKNTKKRYSVVQPAIKSNDKLKLSKLSKLSTVRENPFVKSNGRNLTESECETIKEE